MNRDSICKLCYEHIENHLSEKRKRHTFGVRDTAVKLARLYGAEEEQAEIAALFHDFYKYLDQEESDEYVKKLGLSDYYIGNKNLAHSKIAAAMMKEKYGIEDEDLINAVSFHTTGRENMSLLEKIIYLADAIEPGRDYPMVDGLRRTAEKDLDQAVIDTLEGSLKHVKEAGQTLDPDSEKALRYLLTNR